MIGIYYFCSLINENNIKMIQRIQTVFLLLASISLALTFFFPMAEFIGMKDSLVLYIYKVQSLVPSSTNVYDIWFIMPLLAIVSLVIVFSLITIFMYKNRIGQLKVIRFMMFLIAAMIGVVFLYYYDILAATSGAEPNFVQVGAFAPLLSLVFLYLAYRGVMKDEKLVRSADRLR
ncbi:MAG: DUF4293 domain-containing protein [Marinilabiliales bacterium]|nr:MAG: DUF4293 domain-containing protein [Marinilabiliales bacterium]